ncbi:hypothetical protein MHSWG343_09290 [Candidatus Mycoplasma haematohominis]|uniref:Uncharacterized protein n=1 Tax=Candidatus Mycoplasma haematohominis TaxID=1494318 RepID=A0A478FR80_9MOLU|nr:hypothetical protein MHSWG343_09290 [Candidatus Mycoplasma haemohominis]
MSILSAIVKTLVAIGVTSGAAGVGSKIYLKNGHGFGTMNVAAVSEEKKPVVKRITYGSELKEVGYQLVETSTDKSVLLNIMMERLDPTKSSLTYTATTRFSVSPQVAFKTKEFKSRVGSTDYSLTVLQKPDEKYVDEWKTACITALDKDVTKEQLKVNSSNEGKELARLREWCTIPSVEQVLRRHKLKPLNTGNSSDDEKWKKVIAGGWFKKESSKKNWEDQSFITASDLETVVGKDEKGINSEDDVDESKINVFKNRCKEELKKPFVRNNFYLTTQFIKGISGEPKLTIDPFQEVALLCVESMTAEKYIKDALQGDVKEAVDLSSSDYCYMSDTDYSKWTTNNPLGGKTFWCAVKALYKNKG